MAHSQTKKIAVVPKIADARVRYVTVTEKCAMSSLPSIPELVLQSLGWHLESFRVHGNVALDAKFPTEVRRDHAAEEHERRPAREFQRQASPRIIEYGRASPRIMVADRM